MRFFWIAILLLLFIKCGNAQVRNPFNDEILPLENVGDASFHAGNFENYTATYGYVKHFKDTYAALPFITISKDSTLPFLIVLNGGPGRSNLRLSFPVDSLLTKYQLCLPGYRGIDDGVIKRVVKSDDEAIKTFINNHHRFLNTQSICNDISLIVNALHVDSFVLAAHSYGSILACCLFNNYPQLIDSALIFSPVAMMKPALDPKAVENVLKLASEQQNIPYQNVESILWKLLQAADDKPRFAFGFLSQMYTFENAKKLVADLNDEKLTDQYFIATGKSFMRKEWLIDFALKFCKNSLHSHNDKRSLSVALNSYFL